MNIDKLVVAAVDGYKHNPLRTDQDTFQAGVLALARLIESQNSGKPVLAEPKAAPFVCPSCKSPMIAKNVAGTRYRCIWCGDEGQTNGG